MKKKIALVTGGYSGESVISYKSAACVAQQLDTSRWDYYIIDIRTDGWFYKDEADKECPVDKNDFSMYVQGQKITFDAALIILHGTPGEDGKLQGYFDCIGLPYTSCDATTSAITFNKRYTVALASAAGIPVARSMQLFKEDAVSVQDILSQLTLPLFVKPNNGGSSLGISKVKTESELFPAIEKAFKEDTQILVEEFIAGREFTIGVFKTKGEILALPITEIVTANEFFDYEAKYLGASQEITPAQVDEDITQKIRDTAIRAYRSFHCNGVIRIDFIYHELSGQPYLLEINTVPGQSEASIIPQQVRAMGWTLTRFYSELLENCFTN